MPIRLQLGVQLDMVEDLAVEHDPQVVILVGQGLLPGGDVDDRQPRMSKSGMLVPVKTELVGTPVALGADHPRELIPLGRGGPISQAKNSGYSADGRLPFLVVSLFVN